MDGEKVFYTALCRLRVDERPSCPFSPLRIHHGRLKDGLFSRGNKFLPYIEMQASILYYYMQTFFWGIGHTIVPVSRWIGFFSHYCIWRVIIGRCNFWRDLDLIYGIDWLHDSMLSKFFVPFQILKCLSNNFKNQSVQRIKHEQYF